MLSLSRPLPHILTIDVEDYFQVSAFEPVVAKEQWGKYASRVEANTDHLLNLFEEHDVLGTFFVLGWVAHRFPKLVARIAAAGHEIATHGYWHELVYRLTPEAFRQDLRDSLHAISDAGGTAVNAYRAPSFSITRDSLWALDILADEGITVDSSIFPIYHDRYGIPDARPDIHQRETAYGTITEVPPSVGILGNKKLRLKIPIGGGYFRLFPLFMTRYAFRAVESCGRPAMLYLHPWEIDPAQPRISAASLVSKFRHYVGLRSTTRKLSWLLKNYAFAPMREVLKQHAQNAEPDKPFIPKPR